MCLSMRNALGSADPLLFRFRAHLAHGLTLPCVVVGEDALCSGVRCCFRFTLCRKRPNRSPNRTIPLRLHFIWPTWYVSVQTWNLSFSRLLFRESRFCDFSVSVAEIESWPAYVPCSRLTQRL